MKYRAKSSDTGSPSSTLVELLQARASSQPERRIFTLLADGETEEIHFTFAELDRQAQEIASHLHKIEATGEQALLLYPPGLDYIAGFFGCLYAGVTAVPAYPPDPSRLNRMLPRLQAIATDAQAKFVLTTSPILTLAQMMFAQAPGLQRLHWIATDEDVPIDPDWPLPEITADTLAFLQYTSGSTGMPKGVMITHANLMHNQALMAHGFGLTPNDKAVIWLPPYHDMGLIGGILQPIYTGIHCVLMSPIAFLQRPFRWLQAISRYQATVSGGPNFAYDLAVRKITRTQLAQLDLSQWRLAFNGAEPVRRETLDRFAATFASCGFQRTAFSPCYGLAEATLLVSGNFNQTSFIVCKVQKTPLAQNKVSFATPQDRGDIQTLVGCGQAPSDQKIVITHPRTRQPLTDDQIGEIWVCGDSITQGYWNRPQETAVTFHALLDTGEGPFLRTGDLGFLHAGELFITGRMKDLIIIRGRNHYPQDIELTVEQSHAAVRAGCSAAFSVDAGREERLVVVLEVYTNKPLDTENVMQTVRQAVANEHEVQLFAVVLIQPRTIPKTSSGKIQRHACRQQYLEGSLSVVATHVLETVPTYQKDTRHTPEPLLVKALRAMEPAARHALVTAHLQELLGQVAGLASNQLDPTRPLPSLGLDSAMAVELTHEIETALGIPLRMEYLLQDIAISDLSSQLVTELTAPPQPEPAVITTDISTGPTRHPLSHGQRALWFLHQLHPESPAYNIVYGVRICTEIDLPGFHQAFQKIVNRHTTLRTTFTTDELGEPVQIVHPYLAAFIQVEDATGWDAETVNGRLAHEVYRPFDLENGPLLRLMIYQKSDRDFIILLAMHHIITDLWSLALIWHELDLFYKAETKVKPVPLKPLKINYADYVQRQANMLAAARGEQLRTYWLDQLSGELPVLNLLTDKPRPPVPSYHGACESILLDQELTRRLKALAKQHHATLFMTLLAAFQVLLHRYTGQDDILVGSPKANRTRDVARLVGYFVNPIVIRGNLASNPTFTDFLEQIRLTTLSAFTHSDYPFPLLVEQLQPVRESSQSPLFQVMFAWQKTTQLINSRDLASFVLHEQGKKMKLGDIPLETITFENWVSPFDLTLLMAEAGEELVGTLEYSTDLFEKSTIRRMFTHFTTLLSEIVVQPDQPIALFSLGAEQENAHLSATDPAILPPDLTWLVPERISHISAQQPNAIAVTLKDRHLTYGDLNQCAHQLAVYLQKLGVQQGEPVGVLHGRSPSAIVALLGILKAGGAYLPIEPTVPQERLRFILQDAGLRHLITEAQWMPRLQSLPVSTISLDTDWPTISQERTARLPTLYTPESTAYLIYTSGSTGRPKGVLISHEAIAQHCRVMQQHFELTAVDRVLQFAAFSFDQSLEQILTTLVSGGTLVMRGDDIWEPEEFPQFVQETGLTVINLPPAYWEQTVQAWANAQTPAEHLRLVIIGGDVLRPETIAQWQTCPVRHARLLNAYGPTETTITATTFEIPAAHPLPARMPIGRPLPHRIAHILDKYGNPTPIGIPGELVIGGIGVAKGYLNRPQLTAERFIQRWGAGETGSRGDASDAPLLLRSPAPLRFYKTGDLCRRLPDGNIEFLGRIDHQVKVRGFRIELGEIEAALAQHPAARQTAVLAKDDAHDKCLVAYLAMPVERKPSTGELRRFLKKRLPEYMVPAGFVILDELPMTPGGKINRRLLSTIASSQVRQPEETMAPRNAIESELVAIWRDVLNVPHVGIYDNFFDLGGHSLLATRLASRVRDTFQVDLSLRAMFAATTVADLAVLITQHQAAQIEDKDLEALLEELEHLSTDDVQAILAKGLS